MVPLAELLDDPEWFPAALTDESRTLQFARISREALSQEAFLDQRMAGSVSARQSRPLASIIEHSTDLPSAPPAFIFHSAFCCSTLLARALDVPGRCIALKEPDVLMGLANVLRTGSDTVNNDALLKVIFGLLARRFDRTETVVVKPTNSANNLLPHAIQLDARVLILYGDLRSFLVSVLKKGEACKAFVRTQYNIFGLDPGGLASIPSRQAMTFTDLQVAALVWRHQMELFQQTVAASNRNRVATLDFRTLIDDPAATLIAVAGHLGLPHDQHTLEEIANGPVFSRNSKFADQAYDSEQRASDAHAIEQQYGEALEHIDEWALALNLGTPISLPLGNRLDVPG